ncbi:copper chaperone PCu(A)C [Streptomyces lichenis]|uniref:Copper chaperone PCu(A)C n=1 Tax=Streptomyces lichenis TaxID=2306967 RepID=A0ABT0I4Y3_9ACTN|nr:copper chaperone PCu(A)C [Streptomyces lichenis]MCK8676375.1 copper chaperone PCu(A)C [Streptomyces lichenis]
MTRPGTALGAAMALAAALVLGGCSSSATHGGGSGTEAGSAPRLKVADAYMPQPVGDTAGGFLTVTNTGDGADRLVGVSSPLSDDVEIHETKDQRMREVESFDIPAGGELHLERGGSHLMFMEIKKQPKQGEKVAVELRFEKSGPIRIDLPVEAPTHNPASGHTAHGSAHH